MRSYKAGWDYRVVGGSWRAHTQFGLYDETEDQVQLNIKGITQALLGIDNPMIPIETINVLLFDRKDGEVLYASVQSLPVTESWRSEYLEAVFEHERT
jgi:hypothetical protein